MNNKKVWITWILISCFVLLFLFIGGKEKKNQWFDGKIVDIAGDYMIVEPNSDQEILKYGKQIKVFTKEIVNIDTLQVTQGAQVRVLYGKNDLKNEVPSVNGLQILTEPCQ